MGKWASQRKSGSANHLGLMTAPGAADWTAIAFDATTIQGQRLVAIPAPADFWGYIAFPAAAGTPIATGGPGSGSALNVGGLTTGTNYRVLAAWYKGSVRISDWSAPKNATPGS